MDSTIFNRRTLLGSGALVGLGAPVSYTHL